MLIHWWIKIWWSFNLLSRVHKKKQDMWGNVHNLSHFCHSLIIIFFWSSVTFQRWKCFWSYWSSPQSTSSCPPSSSSSASPSSWLSSDKALASGGFTLTSSWKYLRWDFSPKRKYHVGKEIHTFFLQYAHNSKEKKDHDGAKNGGFFVGKEIPDSDSSEEGTNYQWVIIQIVLYTAKIWIKVDLGIMSVYCQFEWWICSINPTKNA